MLSAGGSLFWFALSYIFEGFSSASDYWIDSTFRVLTFSKEGFRFFVICWSNFTLFNQSSKIAISWCLKRKLRFSAINIDTQCLKITEKVSFDEFLKSLASNSVTRQVSFNWPKIGGKCQSKIQMRHFWVIFKQCGTLFAMCRNRKLLIFFGYFMMTFGMLLWLLLSLQFNHWEKGTEKFDALHAI